MQWDIRKFVSEAIKEKHYVLQKWISPYAKKITTIVHTRFGRQLLNYVTKQKCGASPSEQRLIINKKMIKKPYFKHLINGKSDSGQVDYNKN